MIMITTTIAMIKAIQTMIVNGDLMVTIGTLKARRHITGGKAAALTPWLDKVDVYADSMAGYIYSHIAELVLTDD